MLAILRQIHGSVIFRFETNAGEWRFSAAAFAKRLRFEQGNEWYAQDISRSRQNAKIYRGVQGWLRSCGITSVTKKFFVKVFLQLGSIDSADADVVFESISATEILGAAGCSRPWEEIQGRGEDAGEGGAGGDSGWVCVSAAELDDVELSKSEETGEITERNRGSRRFGRLRWRIVSVRYRPAFRCLGWLNHLRYRGWRWWPTKHLGKQRFQQNQQHLLSSEKPRHQLPEGVRKQHHEHHLKAHLEHLGDQHGQEHNSQTHRTDGDLPES